MPASEATNYSTDQLQVVDITDSTNLDAQQSALLDETKKAKKIPPKGVSMSEVIRLHQVSSNRFLSHLGSLISFLRTEVRDDFNIHGTKNFQDSVFHQKSKIHDVLSLLCL